MFGVCPVVNGHDCGWVVVGGIGNAELDDLIAILSCCRFQKDLLMNERFL